MSQTGTDPLDGIHEDVAELIVQRLRDAEAAVSKAREARDRYARMLVEAGYTHRAAAKLLDTSHITIQKALRRVS